jgi:hypothetical protein
MTHVRCWSAWRDRVAAAALALILTGLVGCTTGPASRTRQIGRESMQPVASAAPEHPCAAFGCEL